MKLSIGPLLFYWPKDQVYDFYQNLLKSPVEIIYLGEVVCSKRHELRTGEWIELATSLIDSGKEIVLSSLALLEARSELSSLKKLCDNNGFMVEANDMSAVQMMRERKLPFSCGPSINIYNTHTLKILQQQGMRRWVMPVELSRGTLELILNEAQEMGFTDLIETEIFSYGKLPLAYSARCFTARAKNLPKDDCRYRCLDHPDGMLLSTQEDQRLFTINGIQTMSGHTYDLSSELTDMQHMGVEIARISPQHQGMTEIIRRFDTLRNQETIRPSLITREVCNGYWYGEPGMAYIE